MIIKELKTSLGSFEIFTVFKDRKNSFFLDSGMDHEKLGRYSFIGFDPIETIKSKNGKVTVQCNGDTKEFISNPFRELEKLLEKYKSSYSCNIPFAGGAVGYLGYDLCHHLEKLPRTAVDDVDIPDMFFGIYDGIIAIDHLEKKTYAAALGVITDAQQIIDEIESAILEADKNGVSIEMPQVKDSPVIESNFTKEDYLEALQKIKDYIRSGDIYQVNMTQRFRCKTQLQPYELYTRLRTINPAPFACYMDFDEGHILSSSPERFMQIRGKKAQTRPIKGTRPRGANAAEDEANRKELENSEKDKSELLMIVDLERNDLGKVCKTGSVKVTELFCIEEYPTVFHLVSTVEGELRDDVGALECIEASFPGGSITGAPKIRAMQVIDELEPTQRNIYTGSIGYIGFNDDADFNIVIRTILQKGEDAYFQAGGGIVWDSDKEFEYEETLHKARALVKALCGGE